MLAGRCHQIITEPPTELRMAIPVLVMARTVPLPPPPGLPIPMARPDRKAVSPLPLGQIHPAMALLRAIHPHQAPTMALPHGIEGMAQALMGSVMRAGRVTLPDLDTKGRGLQGMAGAVTTPTTVVQTIMAEGRTITGALVEQSQPAKTMDPAMAVDTMPPAMIQAMDPAMAVDTMPPTMIRAMDPAMAVDTMPPTMIQAMDPAMAVDTMPPAMIQATDPAMAVGTMPPAMIQAMDPALAGGTIHPTIIRAMGGGMVPTTRPTTPLTLLGTVLAVVTTTMAGITPLRNRLIATTKRAEPPTEQRGETPQAAPHPGPRMAMPTDLWGEGAAATAAVPL